MIVNECQRWEERRERRVPANGTIITSEYEVAPITEDQVARLFIETHHYAGTASSTAHRFGLYWHGELVGVALFGPPASMNAHRLVWPTLAPDEAVTLGRLVLLDCVPGNGESWFVAQCMKLLANPKRYRPFKRDGSPRRPVVGVESCADPIERYNEQGLVVFPGHVGTIYQALGGNYIGRTRRERHRLLFNGRIFSRRAISKIQGAESGWLRDVGRLVELGAVPIDHAADRAERSAWLDTWLGQLSTVLVHDGCLRYVWCLDPRRRRELLTAPRLPYLKIDVMRENARSTRVLA